MTDVRFGIIGIGNIGTTHVARFERGDIAHARLVGICDSDPAALARHPHLKGWSDSAAMIASGEVDAVIIATPHYAHTPISIDALNHGLHVLVEKPLAVHQADCDRMIAAHTDPDQVFAVMFDTRTEPRYRKLRELIQSGQLGRIRRINWILTTWFRSNAYYRSSNWRATWGGEGGGMLVNQLPHDLDLFQWLFGLPRRVRAFCPIGKYHPIEVEDEVNALLEFADGSTAVLVATTGEAPGTDRREIIGDNGRVVVYPDRLEFTRTTVPTSEWNATTEKSFGGPESTLETIGIDGKAGRHTEVINAFVAAILGNGSLIAEASEGRASVSLANAIILSSELDRTVELPLDPATFEQWLAGKRESSTFDANATSSGGVADMNASFSS
jgi:predicted dehydrogenase